MGNPHILYIIVILLAELIVHILYKASFAIRYF